MKPQTGIAIAAPSAEAIIPERNFDLSIGGIQTIVENYVEKFESIKEF